MPPAPSATEQPTAPAGLTRVFIAYDFEIGGILEANLEVVSDRAPEGYNVKWPGSPEGLTQGAIWKNVVQPEISQCDRLLAFVDLPNANVGFEVGYGLGLGKMVALARLSPALAPWLSQPPFHGFLCPRLETPHEIRAEVRSPTKNWIQLPAASTRSPGALLLCPDRTGAAFLEMLPPEWGWRTLPKSGWDLHDLPEQLSGIGLVVWVIAPHHEGPTGRDGRENAALSVIAGYAEARPFDGQLSLATGYREGVEQRPRGDRFDGQLALATGLERIDSAILRLLQNERVWVDDPAKRMRNLEILRRDSDRCQTLFVAWCHETARDADPAAIEPDRALADGLRESLRLAAREHPLLLLLDTCEVLSADLDRWLRTLLVPLCRDETPLLVLIGSRLDPDVALPAGSREGWQAELPRERFRPVPFNEQVRFSVEEIHAALGQLALPDEPERDLLAARLHRVTRGVPLAVRAVLDDLSEHGRDDSLLNELVEADDDEPLNEREAVRRVVGTVARRMLYHLDPERRPEREDDLRDIVALAILQRADGEILRQLWYGQRVRDRLRDLGARYALLSGGDLHATVRDYLRRTWRDDTERPRVFDEVLSAVEQAVDSLPQPAGEFGAPETLARRALLANLQSWRLGDRSLPELARSLTVAVAYAGGTDDLEALLSELPFAGRDLEDARKLWRPTAAGRPERGPVIGWLRSVRDRSAPWSDREQACLALIEGLAVKASAMTPGVALTLLSRLKAAVAEIGLESLPQKKLVGEVLFSIARTLDPYWSHDDRLGTEAEQGYLLASQLGSNEALCFDLLGNLYQNHLGRYDEAERVYLRAIELDPKLAYPHNDLGNLYQLHLGRYDEAERAYLRAIELDPKYAYPHIGLGNLYQHRLGRHEDSERAYLRAIELDPKRAHPHYGLGNLFKNRFGRFEDAKVAYLRAIELDPKYAHPHYGLGNLFKNHLGGYDDAERAYLRAIERDPKYARPHYALGNLYQDYLGRFQEAERAYLRAIELDPRSAYPHDGLGDLYADHLGRYDDAERAYLRAIELDPNFALPHNGLGNLYQDHFGRYGEAQWAYLRAIELDPKSAVYHANLGELYGPRQGRYEEAERSYLQAVLVDPKFEGGYTGLAWLRLLQERDIPKASEYAQQAVDVNPRSPASRLAMIAVTTWERGWDDSRSLMPEWLADCPDAFPGTSRVFLLALFRRIRTQGGLPALAEMLSAVSQRRGWKPWSEAVSALAAGDGPDGCKSDEAKRLYEELSAPP
jgi:tetratricopeptide (TPR) repeat protein